MTVTPQWVAHKYEIRGVLGEGGTGIVYDAVRVEDGAFVALKVMHPQLAGDAQIRGRFRREVAILERLEGPNICPLLDSGEVPNGDDDKTLLYIALPKLRGPSLEEVLRVERPMPLDRGLDVMLQVCAALRSAHEQGVIHRDLKPANVMLVPTEADDERAPDSRTLMSGEEKAVVVDFGMSKIVSGSGTGTTNLTAHNMLFGTPEYMAPEQARGDELDGRCDVYSAGVMLYEILTGAPPFTGPTPLGVLTLHLTADVEPPSERTAPGRVSPAIEAVVMHALSRDRDRRYGSAAALASAIRLARSAPHDLDALRPETLAKEPSKVPAAPDAFASTMPGFEIAPIGDGPSAPLLVVEAHPSSPSPVSSGGTAPTRSSSPSSPSSRAPMDGTHSSRPSRPSTPAVVPSPPSNEPASRTWILLWIVAGLVSIGAGVYLALR